MISLGRAVYNGFSGQEENERCCLGCSMIAIITTFIVLSLITTLLLQGKISLGVGIISSLTTIGATLATLMIILNSTACIADWWHEM